MERGGEGEGERRESTKVSIPIPKFTLYRSARKLREISNTNDTRILRSGQVYWDIHYIHSGRQVYSIVGSGRPKGASAARASYIVQRASCELVREGWRLVRGRSARPCYVHRVTRASHVAHSHLPPAAMEGRSAGPEGKDDANPERVGLNRVQQNFGV